MTNLLEVNSFLAIFTTEIYRFCVAKLELFCYIDIKQFKGSKFKIQGKIKP